MSVHEEFSTGERSGGGARAERGEDVISIPRRNWFSATLEEESARRACHSRVSRVPSGEVRGEEVTGKRGEAGTAGKYTSSSRGRS